jgi:hypothetical protein
LLSECGNALWVTSWPFAEYVKHDWAGAWTCSIFRSEDAGNSSELIRQAIAATRYRFGDPPSLGMVTFIDREKVRPTKVRGQETWGWVWKKAGFAEVGKTRGGLLVFQLVPEAMPEPMQPNPRSVRGLDLFDWGFENGISR